MLQTELGSNNEQYPPSSPIRRLVSPAYPFPGRQQPSVEGAEFVASIPAQNAHPQGIRNDAFSPGYWEKFFKVEKELGQGGKGVVYLVRHELDGVSLGQFACKRVPVGHDHAWLEKVLIEVQLLQRLSHPNLVSYRHVWLEDFQISVVQPRTPCAFILQQYCNGGDLLKYVMGDTPKELTPKQKAQMRKSSKSHSDRPELKPTKSQIRLGFDQIYSFFRDITSGLAHLHESNYIHRDLKPSNCLLHANNGGEPRCLISDFGEVQHENVVRKSSGATGTVSFCAPEVLRRDESGQYGEFSTKSDIFSLGMILYFMCFGRLPYSNSGAVEEDEDDLDMLRAEISSWSGFRDERKERPDLPDQLYEFLRRLLSLNPMERPSAPEILHAIRSGSGLETSRPGRKGSIDHALRFGKRFQNLDTPTPGTPRTTSSAYIEDVGEDGQTTPPIPTEHHELRPKESSDDFLDVYDEQRTPVQHLLLPPPTSRLDKLKHAFVVLQHRAAYLITNNSEVIFGARLIMFLTKVYVLMQPCVPSATNPMVAYPLLLLAAVDLGLGKRMQFLTTMILALFHFIVLLVATKRHALCIPSHSAWQEME